MISSQFKKDYAQMTAQGVTFTPDDIVRLNALAVKVRLTQHPSQSVNLPRLCFLEPPQPPVLASLLASPLPVLASLLASPTLVLREPTIAHDLWLEEASRWIDLGDDANFLFLHAYALSRPAEKLVDAFDPKKLVKTVYRFAAKRLVRFTREQLSSAVEYVLFGANWITGEKGPVKQSSDPVPSSFSPTLGLLSNARALRLPITLDDAKRMTASELEEAILRARLNDRDYDGEVARNEAFAEYVRAREEIRSRTSPRARESSPRARELARESSPRARELARESSPRPATSNH